MYYIQTKYSSMAAIYLKVAWQNSVLQMYIVGTKWAAYIATKIRSAHNYADDCIGIGLQCKSNCDVDKLIIHGNCWYIALYCLSYSQVVTWGCGDTRWSQCSKDNHILLENRSIHGISTSKTCTHYHVSPYKLSILHWFSYFSTLYDILIPSKWFS